MTNEEAIKYLKQLYPNGGHCWLDEQRIEAISMAVKTLQKDSVSEEWIEELRTKLDSMSKEDFKKVFDKYAIDFNEEPVSEDLKEAAMQYAKLKHKDATLQRIVSWDFKDGAKWQKKHLWKPAEGDDLQEIDREVIAILDNGKVVFAHRPPEYWDGKDIVTGKVTRNYPKTYDKGGWNIPNVKYWLDCSLPNMED